MTDTSIWSGSTWERVCRDLFGGDEPAMLAWGRRYLRVYPDVQGEAFHLGAQFREIVGARNRQHWWRTAVELLAARVGDTSPAAAFSVGETAAPAYGARVPVARPGIAGRTERLRIFDCATARQRQRDEAFAAGTPSPAPDGRGWVREDLYE